MSLSLVMTALVFWGANEPVATKALISDSAETMTLTLRDALRIGLTNDKMIDVGHEAKTNDTRLILVPKIAEQKGSRLNADLMAQARAIEQCYWSLWKQQAILRVRDKAVRVCEELVQVEREASKGEKTANLYEIQKCLEKSHLDYITATSDQITAERLLRKSLGLPAADNRRVIVVTQPILAEIQPDWESCLKIMQENQPDIVENREKLNKSEQKLDSLRSLSSVIQAPLPDEVSEILTPAIRKSQDLMTRQKDLFQQVVHQTTHSLARFFLEVDANYKQYRTAQGLIKKAQDHLTESMTNYEAGRTKTSVTQLLACLVDWAETESNSAQYLIGYNVSLASLAEAQGILLSDRGICVQDGIQAVSTVTLIDNDLAKVSYDAQAVKDVPVLPSDKIFHGTLIKDVEPSLPQPKPVSSSVKYQITIENGSKVTRFEGTVTTTSKP